MDATVSSSPFIPALPSAVKYQSSRLHNCSLAGYWCCFASFARSGELCRTAHVLICTVSWALWNMQSVSRVFGSRCIHAMLRNIFRLISTPLPVQPTPCFNSRWFDLWDKLYSLLLSLQPLSRWRAASVNTDRVLIALGNRQSWRPLMEHAQLEIPLKSCFSKEVKVFK